MRLFGRGDLVVARGDAGFAAAGQTVSVIEALPGDRCRIRYVSAWDRSKGAAGVSTVTDLIVPASTLVPLPAGARSTDPTTSHLAARDQLTRLRESHRRVLHQFALAGDAGLTDFQLGDRTGRKQTSYGKLLVDGDNAEAAKVMGQIRLTERGINTAKTQLVAAVAESNAYERVRYDMTVERLEAAYPVLNPDDKDNYDAAQVKEVMDLASAYQVQGHPPAKALQKACSVLLGKETAKQERAVEVTARVDPAEAAKKVAEERRKAQLAKNLDTAGRQPPNAKSVGADSDKAGGTLKAADAIRLPYADFVKLPDSDLARLRGDLL